MVNFDYMMRLIESQFNEIIYSGDCTYRGYFVTVAKEQDFNRIQDKHPNHIYIVVKFLAASLNYGQTLLPITITAVSEDRKLDVCQKLLFEFADRNNLKLTDGKIKQFYTSPQVISNFEEIYDGFRSILYVSGTFLISEKSLTYDYYFYNLVFDGHSDNIGGNGNNDLAGDVKIDEEYFANNIIHGQRFYDEYVFEYVYNAEGERGYWNVYLTKNGVKETKLNINIKDFPWLIVNTNNLPMDENFTFVVKYKKEQIERLSGGDSNDIQHDTQLFFHTANDMKSQGKSKTRVLSLSTYIIDTPFVNKAIAVWLGDKTYAPNDINTLFVVGVEYSNGLKGIKSFKLASYTQQDYIGEFPTANIVLTL